MAQTHRLGISHNGSVSSSTSYAYYNRTFDDITDLFLYACTHGDYMLVYNLLQSGEIKANVSDRMGKSALQLAIEKEHLEVVKVLLDTIPYEYFRDALLSAIYLGHIAIADFILNHPTYRTFSGGFLDPTNPQAYDDSQFSSDITPLILAAQYNRLLIVHQLLLNGERIQKPHAHMCSCIDCVNNSASDSLRQAQIRSSAYKGLSSEVYIALAYPDPILQAFELGHELRTLAKIERYFCEEYEKLANQLSIFVARLLDNVRGYEELEIVLNKTGRPNEEKYEILSRFDLAIQYKEKPFVSHPNCQQKLMKIWYEDLSFIKNTNIFKQAIFFLIYFICFPFLALTYYLFPKSKIGSLCTQPNLKLKAYIVSYFSFIGLIIASSYHSSIYLEKTQFLSTYNLTIYKNYIQLIYQNNQLKNGIIGINGNETNYTIDSFVNCDISLRFMIPNSFQIAIFIWVIGYCWNEFKQIVSLDLHVYLKTPSNYVDCSMNILYLLYFIFLCSSMICARISMNMFQSSDYWNQIARYDTMSDNDKQYYISKTRQILYWLNADRFYWKSGDLESLAEAFFAMGNVVSFCRICFLSPIISFIGPLQVMLDRMMVDIARWIAMMIIFFIAFACSIFLIFSYFSVVLQQKNALSQSSSIINSSILITTTNSTIINNGKCPDDFYKLLNQSIPLITNNNEDYYSDYYDDYYFYDYDNNNNNNNGDTNYSCQQTSNYDLVKEIGPYPAIYYFGQSFGSTILTTFFTLFGVIGTIGTPDRGYELITLSCYKPDSYTYLSGFDNFVSNLGFILYGIFTFLCVTVLINTLIAMLEKTIENIDDRADIEWKFARSKLYMKYIRDGNTLPVPMNLCPSPASIIKLLKRLTSPSKSSLNEETKNSITNKEENSLHLNMGHINNININNNGSKNKIIFNRKRSIILNEKLTYKIVIERIVRRFLLYYKYNIDFDEVKDGLEFREIKNDIASFHVELSSEMDILNELRASLVQSMKKLNENLEKYFDLEQIKQYLNKQKIS